MRRCSSSSVRTASVRASAIGALAVAGRAASPRGFEPHDQRAERLARLVVQLAGDALALVLLRRDDLPQQPGRAPRRARRAADRGASSSCVRSSTRVSSVWLASSMASIDVWSAVRMCSSDRPRRPTSSVPSGGIGRSSWPDASRSAVSVSTSMRTPHAARGAPREQEPDAEQHGGHDEQGTAQPDDIAEGIDSRVLER